MTTHGAIELWHITCWTTRHIVAIEREPLMGLPIHQHTPGQAPEVIAAVAKVAAPVRRRKSWIAGAAAGAMGFAIVIGCAAHAQTTTTTSTLAATDLINHEAVSLHLEVFAPDQAPPRPPQDLETGEGNKIPVINHVPIDEKYPTLHSWLHPISGVDERMPANAERHFGALRHGIDRSECGRGHCGVDLHGPRGRPIVAVAAGLVVRVERRKDGGDGISGRFVKISHEDGTFTTYMHLDSVVAGLDVGDHLEQGQYIGTLGSTGVSPDAPHLHFGLELPNRGSKPGDYTNAHYINPAPFLVRSRIADIPNRKDRRLVRTHAIKPAS